MKKFTIGFIIGIVITVTGVWFYGEQRVRARETASQQEGVTAQAKEAVSSLVRAVFKLN